MRIRGKLMAAAVIAALGSGACGTATTSPAASGGPVGSAGATGSQGQGTEVHFYSINALSGQSASLSKPTDEAVRLLADQVNADGGFDDTCGNHYTLKITSGDLGNDRARAVALLREAAADPSVLGVIGSTSSVGFVAMVPVAGELGIPIISPGSGAIIPEWNDYAFRLNLSSVIAAPILMQKLKDDLDIKRVAVIHDQTQDAQVTFAGLVRDLSSEVGYEVVAFEAFRVGDPDMRSQLTKIKAANPDLIVYSAPGEDLAKVVNQAFELGLGEIPMVTPLSQFDNATVWDLTEGKVEGGLSWTPAIDIESPAVKEFSTAYEAAYGAPAILYALYGRDALALYIDAVKRSCTATDREAFMQSLHETKDFQGIATTVTYGPETGENLAATVKVTRTTGPGESEEVE